jgi:hypothetical protein
MPTNTYVALDTKTIVGSSTSSITFSSIPQGYTDLVIVEQSTGSVAAYSSTYFNGNNTGTNYSWTYMFGTGASAISGRVPNLNRFEVSYHSTSATPNTMIYHIMNYSNSTTFKTMLSRYNLSNDGVGAYVGLWRQTSAITSITFDSLSGNYTAGSTFTIYGIAAASVGAKATGGEIYTDRLYYYHVFDANGTFTPAQNISCDYFILAGGGGGGSYGGGGGAGGLLTGTFAATTSTNYTATIGGGGAGGGTAGGSTGLPGSVGVNSIFNSITATGGGGGGGFGTVGGNGGSGGGGGLEASAINRAGGSASPSGQGNNGGNGFGATGLERSGGGGGGGGAVGGNGSGAVGANGGIGATSSLINAIGVATGMGQYNSSNDSYYFAGGGGGGADSRGSGAAAGTGGIGGGANGTISTTKPAAAVTNRGGGGGGAGFNSTFIEGGNGGSGIVIVRYLKA